MSGRASQQPTFLPSNTDQRKQERQSRIWGGEGFGIVREFRISGDIDENGKGKCGNVMGKEGNKGCKMVGKNLKRYL